MIAQCVIQYYQFGRQMAQACAIELGEGFRNVEYYNGCSWHEQRSLLACSSITAVQHNVDIYSASSRLL